MYPQQNETTPQPRRCRRRRCEQSLADLPDRRRQRHVQRTWPCRPEPHRSGMTPIPRSLLSGVVHTRALRFPYIRSSSRASARLRQAPANLHHDSSMPDIPDRTPDVPPHAEGFGPACRGSAPPVGFLDGAAERRLDERKAFAQEIVGQIPRRGMGRDTPDMLDAKPFGHAHRAEEMKMLVTMPMRASSSSMSAREFCRFSTVVFDADSTMMRSASTPARSSQRAIASPSGHGSLGPCPPDTTTRGARVLVQIILCGGESVPQDFGRFAGGPHLARRARSDSQDRVAAYDTLRA